MTISFRSLLWGHNKWQSAFVLLGGPNKWQCPKQMAICSRSLLGGPNKWQSALVLQKIVKLVNILTWYGQMKRRKYGFAMVTLCLIFYIFLYIFIYNKQCPRWHQEVISGKIIICQIISWRWHEKVEDYDIFKKSLPSWRDQALSLFAPSLEQSPQQRNASSVHIPSAVHWSALGWHWTGFCKEINLIAH